MGTADSVRRRIYSLSAERDQWLFQTLNLDDFTVIASGFPDSPRVSVTTVLHPVTGQVWAVEAGPGEVTAVDPDSQALRRLGGGPSDDRHFGSGAYWNPVTHRIGVFGGYGHLAVRNDRHEFDEENRKWIQIEPNRPGAALWPRSSMLPLVQDASGQRLFVVGGQGSPSGKQGDRFAHLRAFTGLFHLLDDIWELNVGTSTWRQVLALGYLDPQRLRIAVYHPVLKALLVILGTARADDKPGPARTYCLRPGVDQQPCALPSEGDVSILGGVSAWTIDAPTGDLLRFASDGIFRVTIEMEPRKTPKTRNESKTTVNANRFPSVCSAPRLS